MLKEIIKKIKKANKIAIFTHRRPDPDALGSLSSLYEALLAKGKDVAAFLEQNVSKSYEFLNIDYAKTECDFSQFDLVISVDVAAPSMLGDNFVQGFLNHPNSVAIDHHAMRITIAKIEYVEAQSASCAEIIYKLLKALKCKITPRLATLIYTGLAGDTGCFVHDNTTASTHILAGNLMKCGADTELVNLKLFKSGSVERLRLLSLVVPNFIFIGDSLIVPVSFEDFKSVGINPDSGIELIDFVARLDGINLTALIQEKKEGEISVSLRSTKKYDVSILAQKFGGGGHRQASGITRLEGKLSDIITTFEKELKSTIREGL